MIARSVTCSRCRVPLPPSLLNRPGFHRCPGCQSPIQAYAFPALLRPAETGRAVETIVMDGEAGCFYHPSKRAVVPCQRCGRFLCALCDVDVNGEHLCPSCLNAAPARGAHPGLEQRRTLFDSAALSLALLPLLIWPITLVTGPLAVAVGIFSFRTPTSIIPRTRIRAWLAILFGGLETAGWIWLGILFVRGVLNAKTGRS